MTSFRAVVYVRKVVLNLFFSHAFFWPQPTRTCEDLAVTFIDMKEHTRETEPF